MRVTFCIHSHSFSKNTCKFDIVHTRTVNILTTNELFKLTTLWTNGPWYSRYYHTITFLADDFFLQRQFPGASIVKVFQRDLHLMYHIFPFLWPPLSSPTTPSKKHIKNVHWRMEVKPSSCSASFNGLLTASVICFTSFGIWQYLIGMTYQFELKNIESVSRLKVNLT